MKQDLGLLITHIDNSEKFEFLFEELSKLISDNPYSQICIFNSYSDKLHTKNVPILHINQSKFFSGNLLVFDIVSLYLIQSFPLLNKKYFLAQEAYWTKSYNNYMDWHNIINQDNLDIIASNSYIYDIYDICWRQPKFIMETLNYDNLSKLL